MNGTPDLTGQWLNFAQQPVEQGGLGLAPHQAAGLVGNLQNESGQGLSPWGPTGDNGTAWGTAQWRGDRLNALKQMFPDSYQTPQAQMKFLRSEMLGPENRAYKALLAAGTPEAAASAVNHLYERSADTSGNREKAARQLMAQFGGGGGASPALAFSGEGEDDEGGGDASPALSTNSTLGPGALQTIMPAVEKDTGNKHRISSGLVGMAAALASISSPQQAYALSGIAKQLKDSGEDDKTSYKISVGKDGRILRIGSNGQVDSIGGNPDGAAADPVLGDTTKQGAEYFQTLKPADQAIIDGWHEGTGVAPSSFAMKDPHTRALMSAAKIAYPDIDFSHLHDRITTANDLSKMSPSSGGGQVSSSNASLLHLGEIADDFIKMHNGSGGGWATAAHLQNSFKNAQNDPERNGLVQGLNTHGGLAAGEITKFITNGNGGVHERAERLQTLANQNYAPEEAAGVLEAQRNALQAKHDTLVERIKATMGQSYLDKHPEIEKTYTERDASLRDKISQLRTLNKKAAPATGSSSVTPQPGKSYKWTPQGLQEK